jgi:Ca-activated chloride channel family protein
VSGGLLWPWALAALPLPLAVYFLVPRAQERPASALRIPFFGALAAAGSAPSGARPWRALLGTMAWILLVIAAARLQLVGAPIALPMEGRDLMLAVDISGSMVERDMVIADRVVERLTAVKAVAGDFIERREGDRIGLILFGSQAYQQTPLTFDRAETSSYTTGNIALAYSVWDGVEITGRVLNVMGKEYEEVLGYEAPGRRWMLGLRLGVDRPERWQKTP